MKLAAVFLLSASLFLSGCRTPGHISQSDPARLSVGLTKAEVLRKIGPPETVSQDGPVEVLGYTLDRDWWQFARFQVRLQDGRVLSYEVLEKAK